MYKSLKLTLLVLFLILIDQYSKYYFFKQPDSYFIHKHFNQFFIFGSFSTASPEIKFLLTGIIFSTVLLIFFFLDYLLFTNQKIVQWGLWTLFSGIAGNMIDKIFLIGVRDFIHIIPNIYTNVADLTQWIGFSIFTYGIFKNVDQIWHSSSKRRIVLVNPKEQLLFSFTVTFFSFLTSIAFIFTTLSFLKLINISNDKKEIFLVLSTSLAFFTILVCFIFSVLLSTRIWGPLFSFKRHLDNNHEHIFKTRKTDFLKDLDQSLVDKKRAQNE